ncbi:MAG: hypothetical protein Q8P46_03845 [Hyphomicrobiales bacterium]|nr:hypothetical protein [Hyphomicrobiales bacterium]
MYGYRARIGYTSPPAATEVVPYEFYMIVPKGITLVLHTLAIVEMNKEEIDRSYEMSLRAARDLALAGVNLVVLGGVPINLSRGFDNVNALISDTEAKIGVPVTTSITAQIDALQNVGARHIAVGHPFSPQHDQMFLDYIDHYGFERAGTKGADRTAVELGQIPTDTALALGHALKRENPQADTLWLPCPHWAVAEAIDPLEKELGMTVVTALQAIVWHALRRCGVDDRIEGFGRLFREF